MTGVEVRSILIAILLIVVSAIVAFIAARYWHRVEENKKKLEDDRAMELRIVELEHQISLLGQTVTPISAAFQAVLIKQLTHDHSPVLDKLMEKIGPPNVLTDEQQVELLIELKHRAQDLTVSQSERNAAKMLPHVMDRVKEEEDKAEEVKQELQLVKVPGGASTEPVEEKKAEENETK